MTSTCSVAVNGYYYHNIINPVRMHSRVTVVCACLREKEKGLGTASVHCPLSGDYTLTYYFNQVVTLCFPLIIFYIIHLLVTILKTECVGVLDAWP